MKTHRLSTVIKELNVSHKEFFETKFALTILDNPSHFISVKKVTDTMIALLTANMSLVIDLIANNDKIKDDLYNEKYFAHLNNTTINLSSALEIYNQLLNNLTSKETPLEVIIHIHSVFIYRIYDHIIKNDQDQLSEKEKLFQKIFNTNLFLQRGRIPNNNKPSLTNQIGISRNKFFAAKISEDRGKHIPAFHCFIKDCTSPFVQALEACNSPFVAGPSGHTGSLLLGASLYSNLDLAELHNYALACFAYLTCGGNHAFHEVMVVANIFNIPYSHGDYLTSIPASFKQTTTFAHLVEEFPQYLAKEIYKHETSLTPPTLAGR